VSGERLVNVAQHFAGARLGDIFPVGVMLAIDELIFPDQPDRLPAEKLPLDALARRVVPGA
jgi:hypothetical protein